MMPSPVTNSLTVKDIHCPSLLEKDFTEEKSWSKET